MRESSSIPFRRSLDEAHAVQARGERRTRRAGPGAGPRARGHAARHLRDRDAARRIHDARPERNLRARAVRIRREHVRAARARRPARTVEIRRPDRAIVERRRGRPHLHVQAAHRPEVPLGQSGDGRRRGVVAAAHGAARQRAGRRARGPRPDQGQRRAEGTQARRHDRVDRDRPPVRAELRAERAERGPGIDRRQAVAALAREERRLRQCMAEERGCRLGPVPARQVDAERKPRAATLRRLPRAVSDEAHRVAARAGSVRAAPAARERRRRRRAQPEPRQPCCAVEGGQDPRRVMARVRAAVPEPEHEESESREARGAGSDEVARRLRRHPAQHRQDDVQGASDLPAGRLPRRAGRESVPAERREGEGAAREGRPAERLRGNDGHAERLPVRRDRAGVAGELRAGRHPGEADSGRRETGDRQVPCAPARHLHRRMVAGLHGPEQQRARFRVESRQFGQRQAQVARVAQRLGCAATDREDRCGARRAVGREARAGLSGAAKGGAREFAVRDHVREGRAGCDAAGCHGPGNRADQRSRVVSDLEEVSAWARARAVANPAARSAAGDLRGDPAAAHRSPRGPIRR
ncbi:Uncharacterised protein [Burkholderia pseudomallei]|nr:bacterial extracellular solute-binding protein, family 5 [Burkholderia pseudomallei]CAJ8543826.1 Uncharacterised protein [Burkholderia pseudomallei]CAK1268357.1 Uncharacterised protein [Burkholderia pseudomallei]CAK1273976.1 Uncharacterised protein [Burkholderia pseudomallei]CFL16293.1 Uncharacterised protein [Burkholderia pseudomallei]